MFLDLLKVQMTFGLSFEWPPNEQMENGLLKGDLPMRKWVLVFRMAKDYTKNNRLPILKAVVRCYFEGNRLLNGKWVYPC